VDKLKTKNSKLRTVSSGSHWNLASSSRRDWSSFRRLLSSFRVVSSSFRVVLSSPGRPQTSPITLGNPVISPKTALLPIFPPSCVLKFMGSCILTSDSVPEIARHAGAADRDRVASIWTKICAGNRPAYNAGRAGWVVERTSVFGASPAWPDLIGSNASADFLCVNLCLKSCLSCKSCQKEKPVRSGQNRVNGYNSRFQALRAGSAVRLTTDKQSRYEFWESLR